MGLLRSATLLATLSAVALPPALAWAQRDPIVDRNFNLDLYSGAVLGSSRIVSMGGAGVALARGSAYMSANPATPAVRKASSTGDLDWSAHLDGMLPGAGEDFDNNGTSRRDGAPSSTSLVSLGILGQAREWGLGGTVLSIANNVPLAGIASARTTTLVGEVQLARSFFDEQLALGLGLRVGSFAINSTTGGSDTELVNIGGGTLETGAVWVPKNKIFRVGGTLALPVVGQKLEATCDPLDCGGFILPTKVLVPWQMSVGFAWRHGDTAWNRKFEGWRDERELTLAVDVVVTGAVDNGHGVEAFLEKELQPSGESVVVSLRGGAEMEAIPGWLRVRGGSYWEPARFADVSGRIHGTFGLEGRIWSFCLFGHRHRLTLTLTADVASRYLNGGISLGLW